MYRKEFGAKEVLLKYEEEKGLDFSNKSSKDSETIVEAEILGVGDGVEFYKIGDRILIHKGNLIERKHKYFAPNERMIDNQLQIICRIQSE